ncbi:acylphosphatase [Cellulomonas sp. PhB150]|uniref:acylphosphatase n=1 Tax=Cellulomonas sp. PhB150 TaxID=2485188 RepID=UPI000F4ACE1C|nr:acylphosphatase [Cellulomonas sp. PhB150]ROS23826.1 acylphosphatase [Cellulomonas sp. PhB150]
MSSRRVVVHGSVQGVGFRWSARAEAERLGVRGWVRNEDDGSVEAFLTGADEAVEELVAWFRAGPPGAVVTSTDVQAAEGEGAEGFSIRH